MRSGAARNDLFDFGGRVAALVLRNAHARLLAGQRERNKDRLAFDARQKRAAINGLFNLHELGFGERSRAAWFRAA